MLTALIASAILAQATAAPAAPKASAPEPEITLIPGSPAPAIDVEHWVRGDAPKFGEAGKVYVVEFWATWCGPCKASMPHLSKLQDEYADKNVVIVGISDENLEKVSNFLNEDKWKQEARYTVATDPDRSVHKDFMAASGSRGIPTAFIVKDNTVQWIGHPMTMDEPLAKVVAGTWDVAAAKTKFQDDARVAKSREQHGRALAKARTEKNWPELVKLLDKAIAETPAPMNTNLRLQKFQILVGDADMAAEGYKVGRELLKEFKDNPQILNAMSWFVLDDKSVKNRNLEFAMDAAQAAVTASKGEEPAILDTLARAYWETGNKPKAVETQMKAVELAEGDGEAKESMQKTLTEYQTGQAPKPSTRKSA